MGNTEYLLHNLLGDGVKGNFVVVEMVDGKVLLRTKNTKHFSDTILDEWVEVKAESLDEAISKMVVSLNPPNEVLSNYGFWNDIDWIQEFIKWEKNQNESKSSN